MKIRTVLFLLSASVIAACSTSKKATSTTTTASSTPAASPSTDSYLFTKPANGLRPPGNDELASIQLKYKDATLDKLKQGYVIYTQGACINCHAANDIYQYGPEELKNIVDDMALKANITDAEKDAVYKYVISIRTTQAK